MRKYAVLFLCSVTALGTLFAAPQTGANRPPVEASPAHHVWSAAGPLTQPSSDSPALIGRRFLTSTAAAEFGLSQADLAGVYLVKEYRSTDNGVTHLIFRQQFDGYEVHGSEFTVNISANGEVLNAGGTLYTRPETPAPNMESAGTAARVAVQAVNPAADSSYLPAESGLPKGAKTMKFVRGGLGAAIDGQPVWYPAGRQLRAGWAFYQLDGTGHMFYRTIIDSVKQAVVKNTRLGAYQNPQPPRGLVFLESPQPDPKLGTLSTSRPYVERTLVSFAGDPQASPRGWLAGTETAGNNTITGHNPTGTRLQPEPVTAKSPTRDFSFPLQLGPGAPNPTNFKDAATTNLFYWVNRTHDFLWHVGFDEAAGNFQVDNFGRGGVGGDPMYAYSQFGVAQPGIALLDNASFTFNFSAEDGFPGYVRMYLAGDRPNNIFSDGSYDAGIIIHEYVHGVSARLAHDVYDTYQGRAMGEAWSDYVALEILHPEGLNPTLPYVLGEYAFQQFGSGSRTRPYSTDLRINSLTFADYGRVADIGLEEHLDGEIWVEALWEARANFMRLYGEKEGRKRMLTNVIEGMKLQPPRASMIEARDAMILANRATYKGAGEQELWKGFAKRGLGVLAMSMNGDSSYVVASNETVSDRAVIRFHSESYVPNELVRIVLYDGNNTSPTALAQITTSNGDLEHVTLRRRGAAYEGAIWTGNDASVRHRDEALDTIPSDVVSVFYVDHDTGNGKPELIMVNAPVQPEYTFTGQPAGPPVVSGTERALFQAPAGGRNFLQSARVTLPFNFQFFDRTYRVMYVSGNGLITFGSPNPTFCNDWNSASSVAAIAPMWTEIFYGGQAQSAENVYYSTAENSVTVRWAGETPYTSEPINFSAVLYDDGRIRFQYGEGNNNLVSTPILGCSTNTPVVGLSAGRDSYQVRYGFYDGVPNLNRAPAVLVDPPFNPPSDPVVRIETPEMNGRYSGVLTVRGIAYDNETRITRLDLIIDGVARGMITPSTARNPNCVAENLRGCVGFVRNVDLAALGIKPGVHRLQVRGTNSRGSTAAFPEQPVTFTFEGSEGRLPVVVVETPESGATLTATTTIRGYAYASDLRIATVAVMIDGVTYGTAIYGLRRDDVCGALETRAPNCPGVGFQFSLNTLNGAVQLPNGTHSLQIRVTDESGRFTTSPAEPITINVDNPPNAEAIGRITSPAPNARLSGTVKIAGWAYDPNGTVVSADYVVGFSTARLLRYGLPAPEACAALTDVAACPNIGFEADFDTTLLPNGQHLIYVRVRDNSGRTLYIPNRNGLTVNIQN